jgi:predicted transcriptional regulator
LTCHDFSSYTVTMNSKKFSSKMDADVLKELREFAKRERKPISAVLSEAVSEYLGRVMVRPVFRDAADAVFDEHDELLERLAK